MARDVLGKVVNMSARGLLVRSARMVPIGTRLVDVRDQPVGKVVDVIGPVAAPYLVLAPPKGGKGGGKPLQPGREVYLP